MGDPPAGCGRKEADVRWVSDVSRSREHIAIANPFRHYPEIATRRQRGETVVEHDPWMAQMFKYLCGGNEVVAPMPNVEVRGVVWVVQVYLQAS